MRKMLGVEARHVLAGDHISFDSSRRFRPVLNVGTKGEKVAILTTGGVWVVHSHRRVVVLREDTNG